MKPSVAMTENICPACGAVRKFERVSMTHNFSVRGHAVSFRSDVDRCTTCGESRFDEARDGALIDAVYSAAKTEKP